MCLKEKRTSRVKSQSREKRKVLDENPTYASWKCGRDYINGKCFNNLTEGNFRFNGKCFNNLADVDEYWTENGVKIRME